MVNWKTYFEGILWNLEQSLYQLKLDKSCLFCYRWWCYAYRVHGVSHRRVIFIVGISNSFHSLCRDILLGVPKLETTSFNALHCQSLELIHPVFITAVRVWLLVSSREFCLNLPFSQCEDSTRFGNRVQRLGLGRWNDLWTSWETKQRKKACW